MYLLRRAADVSEDIGRFRFSNYGIGDIRCFVLHIPNPSKEKLLMADNDKWEIYTKGKVLLD